MASTQQKIEALERHLPYEMLMLRHTYGRIERETNHLNWNMALESFAVHARILKSFLTNDDGSGNFQAKDFSSTFPATRDQSVASKLRKLNERVFHLGKQRVARSESVREHHAGLHSFRSMRRMEARRRKASAL